MLVYCCIYMWLYMFGCVYVSISLFICMGIVIINVDLCACECLHIYAKV